MHAFESEYRIADKVHIDGETAVTASVIAVRFSADRAVYEVSWWHNGISYSLWSEGWRLSPA